MQKKNLWPNDVPFTLIYEDKKPIDYIKDAAKKCGNSIALITKTNIYTYSEFLNSIEKFSAGLNKLGIGKDDRVGIALNNCVEFAIAFYAILNLGAIAVLIDPSDSVTAFERKTKETEPEAIIIHDYLFPKYKKILLEKICILVSSYNHIKEINLFQYIYSRIIVFKTSLFDDIRSIVYFDELIQEKHKRITPSSINIDDIACIVYSVGSKGINFSHRDLTIGAQQVEEWMKFNSKNRFLSIFPLTKSFGLSFCLNLPLKIKASIILISPYDVDLIFQLIEKYEPSIFIGTSGFFESFIHSNIDKYNLTSLKYSFTIDKLSTSAYKIFKKKTKCDIIEAYGLTETSTVQCSNHPDISNRKGIGIPLPDVKLKIVDFDNFGLELPANKIGEIAIKSPSLMKSYWDPKESLRRIKNGWLLTGDAGKKDDDGYFYIYNKKWDIIKTDLGYIIPKEIEIYLDSFSKIQESFITCIKNNEVNYIVAGIKLENENATAEEILSYCIGKLEAYQIPDIVIFVDKILRADNGRIDRHKMKAFLRQQLGF